MLNLCCYRCYKHSYCHFAGGSFSGPGVSNSIFWPSIAGVGKGSVDFSLTTELPLMYGVCVVCACGV